MQGSTEMASTADTGGRPRGRRARTRGAAGPTEGLQVPPGRGVGGDDAADWDGDAVSFSTETQADAPAITNPLNAGAGILGRMRELGDHPIRDAEYLHNGDGSLVEQCWGTRGLYIASNASGQWEVAGPFGGGA
jgi:hypothetical protein